MAVLRSFLTRRWIFQSLIVQSTRLNGNKKIRSSSTQKWLKFLTFEIKRLLLYGNTWAQSIDQRLDSQLWFALKDWVKTWSNLMRIIEDFSDRSLIKSAHTYSLHSQMSHPLFKNVFGNLSFQTLLSFSRMKFGKIKKQSMN